MKITFPELSLILLIGPTGCGKSTFARKYFKPSEVLSSDFCRGLVSNDENDQAATKDAFEVLHFILRKRLAAGHLTVIDATNVQPESRKPLIEIAHEYHVMPGAIVFDLPEKLCREHNQNRADRNFGPHVIRNQAQQMRRSLRHLDKEGFRNIYTLQSPEQVDAVTIERQKMWTDRREEHGPFDIIGDVHGCFDELQELLTTLGYKIEPAGRDLRVTPPAGRKAVFLGDLVDRGPRITDVLRLVMAMVRENTAICVPGNHDIKLQRKLRGKEVKLTHGIVETLAQLEAETPEFIKEVSGFLDELISHYVLDRRNLVVAHAGMKESMQGRGSGAVRAFALFGETTGETDEFGLPVRYNWAADYRGRAMVVYGHTPVAEPQWLNRTVNIDTGCVFGGKLTALRYPEKEFVSVPARKTYYESAKPFLTETATVSQVSQQHEQDDLLDIDDVLGKRIIETRLHGNLTIREENAIAALEVMSRFAINPKWLIYLPPTMSPTETSQREGLLEHPAEGFEYFAKEGVAKVVCEQKHMGSRAVVIICRDRETALQRFGVTQDGIGVCYTRTGRRFFSDAALERELLARIQSAVIALGLFDELKSDWLCLDCELMPWSAKAQELLRRQYAPAGAAAREGLSASLAALNTAAAIGSDISDLVTRFEQRSEAAAHYADAYRQYCWQVNSLADYKLAPFHLLASEHALHTDKDHVWHMETLARLCAADPQLLLPTPYRIVELADETSKQQGIEWWEQLTASGGEGMVIKPYDFVARGRGLIQPAVKCRGREYLRIIYGPEYTLPEHLSRLRSRGLGRKRSLALREFALGIESLQRFVEHEPLRRVHECAFGVLALESEPVDPRL